MRRVVVTRLVSTWMIVLLSTSLFGSIKWPGYPSPLLAQSLLKR